MAAAAGCFIGSGWTGLAPCGLFFIPQNGNLTSVPLAVVFFHARVQNWLEHNLWTIVRNKNQDAISINKKFWGVQNQHAAGPNLGSPRRGAIGCTRRVLKCGG
jgi:hypothetical protein